MSDLVLIPLPGLGTLELTRNAYEAALRPIGSATSTPAVAPIDAFAALLDAKALARELSLPVSWIREKARQGAIPCTRAGRYVRFSLIAVRKAIAAQDTQSIGRR